MNRTQQLALGSAFVLSLAACSNNDNNRNRNAAAQEQSFDVTVLNLTAGQPLSPAALIAHDDSFSVFTVGQAASDALELLAEGGDNSEVIASANDQYAAALGTGIITPAGSETISISFTPENNMAYLSLSTMLVNTNDAITGFNNFDTRSLVVGESVTITGITYDSGTEANSEAAGTIPGPADGGEGFNANRDDIADQVTAHAGVITSDDGLSSSVLTAAHRWDNPTIRVTITRTE